MRAAWRRLRSRRWSALVIDAALIVAVMLGVHAWQTRDLPVDEPAPETVLALLDGSGLATATRPGQAGIVYFFAPWCKICAASSGNLNRLRRWRDPADIEIVAVALDWNLAQEVRDYVERHDLNVTVVLGGMDVRQQWQIQAYPSYYVLDREHRILRRDIGYSTQLGLWLRAWTVS